MHVPNKYFHDRIVLLLLVISSFVMAAGSIYILMRLGGSQNDGYIVQYRANLGVSAFKAGKSTDLLAFIVYLFLTFVLGLVLSIRAYRPNRHLAITILGLNLLLMVMAVIVSNALLVLR